MGEKKTTPITIDDVQYVFEDMKPEQQAMVNHIADLDRKIGSTQFNLEQLQVGKQAFIDMLKKSLDSDVVEIKEAA
jgi:restriction endonuclease S subunit